MINRRLLLSLLPLLFVSAAWADGATTYRSGDLAVPPVHERIPFAAVPEDEAARIRRAVDQGRAEPLGKILQVVRNRYPGEVISIRLKEGRGSLLYTIRVLSPDGRLIDVQVNASSAAILGDRG